MKKTKKKLVLAKETVRVLGELDLTGAQGGDTKTTTYFCTIASGAAPCFYSADSCYC